MSMTSENNSFLAEGYDFIEEGFDPTSEPLTFTEVNEDIIVESESSSPHQYKILGRAAGVFQSVGGFSRNNRRYLPEHWKIQLDKPLVQERLAQRDYMGTIGHHDHPVLDCEIAQGLVSHLLSKLEIREDASGKPYLYGEIEILDTPAGRILKAMYEGGASIFVSSRAAGKLRPVPGQTYQEVGPLNYHFEGFDVVRRAGFPVAKPVYEEVKNTEFPKPSIQEQNSVSEGVQIPYPQPKPEQLQPTNETKEQQSTNETKEQQPIAQATNESQEIQELKGQINKLAKIIEKVVDDVYEDEQPATKQPVQETAKSTQEEQPSNEALVDFVNLMASSNISEKAFEEVIDIIAKSKKESK